MENFEMKNVQFRLGEIECLYLNEEKALAMGEAGRKIVEKNFTVENMVKRNENLYTSQLSTPYTE